MKSIFMAILALGIVSCRSEAVSSSKTDNNSVTVELLFTHDGVKVYRFSDGGRTIYYTDARGVVSWNEVKSVGKDTHIENHRVENVK